MAEYSADANIATAELLVQVICSQQLSVCSDGPVYCGALQKQWYFLEAKGIL